MAVSERFLPPIPEGHQIFEADVELVGVEFFRDNAISFIQGDGHTIEVEHEPSNDADKNAIAVYGCWRGLFFRKRRKIGYVPADIAKNIAVGGIFHILSTRLRNIYLSDRGYCVVEFDLVGPASEHKAYRKKLADESISEFPLGPGFVMPSDDDGKISIGRVCEAAGDIGKAIACYEASIAGGFEGSFPFDRLLAIYRKRKKIDAEIRVLSKAVEVFENVAKKGRSDGPSKLNRFQERLAKIEERRKPE